MPGVLSSSHSHNVSVADLESTDLAPPNTAFDAVPGRMGLLPSRSVDDAEPRHTGTRPVAFRYRRRPYFWYGLEDISNSGLDHIDSDDAGHAVSDVPTTPAAAPTSISAA